MDDWSANTEVIIILLYCTKNGVFGNYNPLRSELAQNPTLQELPKIASPTGEHYLQV